MTPRRGPTAVKAAKTHCQRGHPFDEENTVQEGNRRRCRACKRAADLGYKRAKVRVPGHLRVAQVHQKRDKGPALTPMPEFMMRGPRTPCADDPDLHNHGKHGEAGAELDRWAKQVCRPCPFRAQCKQWAIDNDQRGVWGGTTYRERIASL